MIAALKQRHRRLRSLSTLTGGSVQVWGANLYYEASGVAESGPTMLLLHESGGSSATWHGQLLGLAPHVRCLAPDLPGHGRSEGGGYESVAEYRQAILEFLDALAIRWPVVLSGVCFGTAVAVDLAIHAPDRVAGLILSGVSEGGRANDQVRRATALGEAPETFVHGLFSTAAPTRLTTERLRKWRNTSPLTRHRALSALTSYPLREALHAVQHPVLLIAGEEDPIATAETAHEITAGLPNGRMVALPKAGCLAMVEQALLFNQSVSEFLEELQPYCPLQQVEMRPGGYRRH